MSHELIMGQYFYQSTGAAIGICCVRKAVLTPRNSMYWKHLKVNIFALICIDSRRCLRRHSRKKKIPREKRTEIVPTALGLFDFLAYKVPMSLHLSGRCWQKKYCRGRPENSLFVQATGTISAHARPIFVCCDKKPPCCLQGKMRSN